MHRIMNVWAYVATDTPLTTKMALREKLPEKYWIRINGLLVAFGQSICRPVAPHCDACPLADLCPRLGVSPRRPGRARSGATGEMPVGNAAQLFLSWNVQFRRSPQKPFLNSWPNSDQVIVRLWLSQFLLIL